MVHATITVDLSYGDAGKGVTAEYLAATSTSAAVIRFNGGPQAEHNIVRPDGRHHTFSQFGAASFLPEVPTHLSVDMLVNPLNMFLEASHLIELGVDDIWQRTTVDQFARIVTPYHQAGNRLRELVRGNGRHGSTGQGISEAILDWMFRPDLALQAGELTCSGLAKRLEDQRRNKLAQMAAISAPTDTPEWEMLCDQSLPKLYAEEFFEWTRLVRIVDPDYLATLAKQYDHLVFEAAQGVLLDEKRGFHPHTTWSNTTPDNARRQLEDIGFSGKVTTLGIVRSYTTRHGFGPFVTEDPALNAPLAEYFNDTGLWQGQFRIGHFDSLAHRYALAAIGGVDGLVITGLDRTEKLPQWKCAVGYKLPDVQDAGRYFLLDKQGVPHDIRVGRYGDKAYVTRLGQLLFQAKALYSAPVDPSADSVIEAIERELKTPVRLTSHGPTVNDKKVH